MSQFDDKPRLDDWSMAMRASHDVHEGMVVNLGMGIPMLVSAFVEPDREVLFHTENGIIGFGRVIEDPDLVDPNCVNAGGQPVERAPGMSFMSHSDSFALIRGGWIDVTMLGSLQVGANGDLSNYHPPGKIIGSIGGAQDLAYCAKKVVVLMTHQTKAGGPKIMSQVTLPITAPTCVSRIVTDVAVLDVTADGIVLREVLGGWDPREIQEITDAELVVPTDVGELSL
ncbi:MAG TPA: CoA-transferase [Ilumatobacter sp.]|nr:CoA-transferase [Ilumatobacter sp.]